MYTFSSNIVQYIFLFLFSFLFVSPTGAHLMKKLVRCEMAQQLQSVPSVLLAHQNVLVFVLLVQMCGHAHRHRQPLETNTHKKLYAWMLVCIVRVRICVGTGVCMRACVRMGLCLCACVHVCLCVCACVWVCGCVDVGVWVCGCAYACVFMWSAYDRNPHHTPLMSEGSLWVSISVRGATEL